MRNRTSLIILLLVILLAFVTSVVASSLSGNDAADATHAMPDGTGMREGQTPR
jgi:hypothetical protein